MLPTFPGCGEKDVLATAVDVNSDEAKMATLNATSERIETIRAPFCFTTVFISL
jgi:hypothetical protein